MAVGPVPNRKRTKTQTNAQNRSSLAIDRRVFVKYLGTEAGPENLTGVCVCVGGGGNWTHVDPL